MGGRANVLPSASDGFGGQKKRQTTHNVIYVRQQSQDNSVF
jgi:hypothetical protein